MSKNPTLCLLVTAGDGPAECRIAVSQILKRMEQEAQASRLSFEQVLPEQSEKHGPSSALITLTGHSAEEFAKRWAGTIQWTCQSPVRPNHKRRNWFVGIFVLPEDEIQNTRIEDKDLKFETFRAGGPGGQHQNTTDSAVRVIHLPTNTVCVCRDQRSQHRNKQQAVRKLADKLILLQSQQGERKRWSNAQLHGELERGNPLRRFTGKRFVEK